MINYNKKKLPDIIFYELRLFSGLCRENIENIKKYIIIKNYKKGEKIKNELGKYLLIIYKGKVKEFQNPNNRNIIHAFLKKGETFGETFVFDNSNNNRKYIAVENTELLLIGKRVLFKLIKKYPKFSENIIENMM